MAPPDKWTETLQHPVEYQETTIMYNKKQQQQQLAD